MKRGFMCILYHTRGPEARVHRQTPREVWLACLMIAVKTFRYHHPGMPLRILDIHDLLVEEEKHVLARLADLAAAPELVDHGYGHDTFNKIIALEHSPFRETCILDLDFVFTGSMESVFDLVHADMGVLDYPNYRRTDNRINTGVLVLRNRDVLPTLKEKRVELGPGMTEEALIDHCLTAGLLSVTKLPDRYGKSKQMWWAESPRDLTRSCASKWVGSLSIDWESSKPVFRLGEEIVSGWHFSSAKQQMTADPLVNKYMEIVNRELGGSR